MGSTPVKVFVRGLFALTSRDRALHQSNRLLEAYASLAEGLSREEGARVVEVPPMRGVDEDMRRWLFYTILEHNCIVNRCITAIVTQLARSEEPSGDALTDPKTGVMPSSESGPEQVAAFTNSVRFHQQEVAPLRSLRGTRTSRHPVFGPFDAHCWNCMFSFHLGLHLPQAKYVVQKAREKPVAAGNVGGPQPL